MKVFLFRFQIFTSFHMHCFDQVVLHSNVSHVSVCILGPNVQLRHVIVLKQLTVRDSNFSFPFSVLHCLQATQLFAYTL